MNFRVSVWLTIATVSLSSCFTTRIDNNFGGSWSPSKTGVSTTNGTQATFQGALFDSLQVVNVPQKEEHALSEKVVCNSSLTNLNNKCLNRINEYDQPEKEVSASLKKHKQQLKQKIRSFLPDSRSRWDYWLLFGIFALALILAIALISYGASQGSGDMTGVIGIIALLQSLVTFIGLKSYRRMLKCGAIFGFGLWASVFFWWFFFIPIALWIIISLLC